jgi:hypothetical protein
LVPVVYFKLHTLHYFFSVRTKLGSEAFWSKSTANATEKRIKFLKKSKVQEKDFLHGCNKLAEGVTTAKEKVAKAKKILHDAEVKFAKSQCNYL